MLCKLSFPGFWQSASHWCFFLRKTAINPPGNPTQGLWVGARALCAPRTRATDPELSCFLTFPLLNQHLAKNFEHYRDRKKNISGLEGSHGGGNGFGELKEGEKDSLLLSASRGFLLQGLAAFSPWGLMWSCHQAVDLLGELPKSKPGPKCPKPAAEMLSPATCAELWRVRQWDRYFIKPSVNSILFCIASLQQLAWRKYRWNNYSSSFKHCRKWNRFKEKP